MNSPVKSIVCLMLAMTLVACSQSETIQDSRLYMEGSSDAQGLSSALPDSVEECAIADPTEIPQLHIFAFVTPPPYLKMTEGSMYDIDYRSRPIAWNGELYEKTDVFHDSIMAGLYEDPPIVEYEPELDMNLSTFSAVLTDFPPSKVEVMQYVLHPIGENVYETIASVELDVKMKNMQDQTLYTVTPEPLVQTHHIESEVLYGISITVTWLDNTCEYAFLHKPVAVTVPESLYANQDA